MDHWIHWDFFFIILLFLFLTCTNTAKDKSLNDHLLAKITSVVECSVCSEIMNVPFMGSCGHTFCYECLKSWFTNKVNCPTCRQSFEYPPVLDVPLKDISRNITDLIIETCNDNTEKQKMIESREESIDVYDRDYRAKTLFDDVFDFTLTVIDKSDGVPRCGNCHWEANGSVCLHCGSRFRMANGQEEYFDSADEASEDENSEEINLYGREDDVYDSEDSFVDGRDLDEIHGDLTNDANDILSDVDNNSNSNSNRGSWHGFDGEIIDLLDSYSDGDLHSAIDQFNQAPIDLSDEDRMESVNDEHNDDYDYDDDDNDNGYRQRRTIQISDDESD